MEKLNFGPLITAVVTTFDAFKQVDIRQFEKLLDHLLATGSTGIVVTGTTGESPTLNSIEKLHIWETAVDYVEGKVPIIAGVGTNNTKTTLHNVKLAEEVGVDALLVVVPYYNRPSQKGLLKHFRLVAESTELPIILYNIPARSGVGLELDTILELAELANVVGIKDSSGDLSLMQEIKESLGDDFLLYSGDDALYLETLKLGGAGVVSVASHLVGNSMKAIYEAYISENIDEAEALNARLLPFYQGIFKYPNPSPIKALLREHGLDAGGVRLPLASLEKYEAERLWEEIGYLADE